MRGRRPKTILLAAGCAAGRQVGVASVSNVFFFFLALEATKRAAGLTTMRLAARPRGDWECLRFAMNARRHFSWSLMAAHSPRETSLSVGGVPRSGYKPAGRAEAAGQGWVLVWTALY